MNGMTLAATKPSLMRLLFTLATIVSLAFAGSMATMQQADASQSNTREDPLGTLELAGSDWLNGSGASVYSNGSSAGNSSGVTNYVTTPSGASVPSGEKWQCVELVNRLYLQNGWITSRWTGNGGQMYDKAPIHLSKEPNGSITNLQPGDVVVLQGGEGGFGHVSIVSSVSGTLVNTVNQNTKSVFISLTLNGGTLTGGLSGYTIKGVVHRPGSVAASSLQAEPEGPNLPVGDIALQREPGGVRVYGWATDPDTSAALAVHVYGGTGEATSSNPLVGVYADQYRSDVGNHAFSAFFTVGAGQHTFCAYGINVGLGQNRRFDCASITVISTPVGNLESVQRVPGGVQLSGWALDPDYGGQILVHAYGGNGQAVSGNPMAAAYTDVSRPDVAAAWPGYGDVHGFSLFISTGSSTRFCLYGFNVSGTPGSTSQLPCYDLNVAPNPVGNLESVQRVPGGVQLSGWALDPDTSGPILVHLYGGSGAAVSGNPLVGTYADVSRPDVAAAWPGYGDAHGFSVFMPTGSNVQTFCLYGINANGTPGSNGQILCRNG